MELKLSFTAMEYITFYLRLVRERQYIYEGEPYTVTRTKVYIHNDLFNVILTLVKKNGT